MRTLIGTPIHQSKDYALKRWLATVAELTTLTRTDILLIDNSPDAEYIQKVKQYCQDLHLNKCTIKHIRFKKNTSLDERIEFSQEIIRQFVLDNHYDFWFSWECDEIIPPDSLKKLLKIMLSGNYQMVIHDSKARGNPKATNTNMGLTLFTRPALEKIRFYTSRRDVYSVHNPLFKKRLLLAGGNYAEIFGVISPILHLEKGK